jgi:hypothetical protein
VDESVCHLQDSSFQVSLGREGTVPVWVGLGWLATERDLLQSTQVQPHSLIRLRRSELEPQLISSIARSSVLLHTEIRNSTSANSILAHHTLSFHCLWSMVACVGCVLQVRVDPLSVTTV